MLNDEDKMLLAKTYNNKGLSLAKLERHRESLYCYDKAIDLGYRKAILNKGISLSELNQEDEAIECFDKLITELELEDLDTVFDDFILDLEHDVELYEDIEATLREVKATQKMEGLEVSKEVEELIRKCFKNEITFDEAREQIFKQIKAEESPANEIDSLLQTILQDPEEYEEEFENTNIGEKKSASEQLEELQQTLDI